MSITLGDFDGLAFFALAFFALALCSANELKNQPSLGDIRRKANVTQRKLADKLNVTVKTVSAWECGEHEPRLTPQQIALLLETLNCSLDDLIAAIPKQSYSQPQALRLTLPQTRQLIVGLNCSVEDLVNALQDSETEEQ